MWIVHRIIRAGYGATRATGILSTPIGVSAYRFVYERYKSFGDAAAIRELCRDIVPGSIAIDVGANVGTYSAAFAKQVSRGGKVLAIEAEPDNAAGLRKRFSTVGDVVHVIEAAAADRAGSVNLRCDPNNPAGHVVSLDGIEVRSVTLDDLVAEIGLPVSVVKIDVEGAEPLVIDGALTMIERDRPTILLEFSPDRIASFNRDPVALLQGFLDLGYNLSIPGQTGECTITDIREAAVPRQYIDVLMRKKKH